MQIYSKESIIDFKRGTVILAGAGPGSLKQVTLKVYKSIQEADVIIYDALVNTELLKFSKKKAELQFGGKTKTKKSCSQSDINEWLLFYAKNSKRVLRLKGGDTSFFSRGSQEIKFLKNHGIKYKIFTGITSSQLAVKNAGIKFFNHKGVCNFITGHRKIIEKSVSNNFKDIYKNGGKIIIYMGVSQIKEIISNLKKLGISKNKEVIIVSNASLSNEKVYFSNISEINSAILKNKITPPSIIIIS